MVQPDLGINVLGPKVALQYNLGTEARSHPSIDPPSFEPSWEFVVGGLGGLKSIVEQRTPIVFANVGTFDVTAAVQRHFYQFGKFAGGTDVLHSSATGTSSGGVGTGASAGAGQPWGLGIYGGYEHVIARLSAVLQVGDNVVRTLTDSNARRLYTRYGWRYQASHHVWGTLAIRAHGFRRADALEVGLGYRFSNGS